MSLRNLFNKFAFYFKNSYGVDKLSIYLFIAGILLLGGGYTAIFGYALILYGLWRSFSKNNHRRSQELYIFEDYLTTLKQIFYRYKASFSEQRKNKIFKCPSCSQKLRVPRNKGKIVIICKKCGTEFKGKS